MRIIKLIGKSAGIHYPDILITELILSVNTITHLIICGWLKSSEKMVGHPEVGVK